MGTKKSLIPNSMTMTNMIIGFVAILFAGKGDAQSITIAGVLIFVASFFDFFDGAAARALKAQSEIGMQLDSLADSVSYGIAPAVIAYNAYLYQLPELGFSLNTGMFVAVVFPVFAVYRLARFNLEEPHKGFTGLPSPAAGVFVASIPTLEATKPAFLQGYTLPITVEVYTVLFLFVGLLMVTQVDYSKLFSDLASRGRNVIIITIAFIIISLALFNMWAVFVVTSIYIFVGLLLFFLKKAGLFA